MALSALKTWVPGEVLTASDLNSEFVRIYSGGESLGWPATVTKDLNGQTFVLDADGDSTFSVKALDDRADLKLQNVLLFRWDGTTGTPVTGIDWIAGATGVAPQIKATGETDTSLNWVPAGTGTVQIEGDEVATIRAAEFYS